MTEHATETQAPASVSHIIVNLEQIEAALSHLGDAQLAIGAAYSLGLNEEEQRRLWIGDGAPVASERVLELVREIRDAVGCGDFDGMLYVESATEGMESMPGYIRDVREAISALGSCHATEISSMIENVDTEFGYVEATFPSDGSFEDLFTAQPDGDLINRRDRVVQALSELAELGV